MSVSSKQCLRYKRSNLLSIDAQPRYEFGIIKMSVRNNNLIAHKRGSKTRLSCVAELTAELAAAYVSKNYVSLADLPEAIRCIHSALLNLQTVTSSSPERHFSTSVEVAASIEFDRLISFIDGKAYKSLKRHLTAHGLTPDEYRRRYGLSRDYPMVSPGYAQLRSRIASQTYYGLESSLMITN